MWQSEYPNLSEIIYDLECMSLTRSNPDDTLIILFKTVGNVVHIRDPYHLESKLAPLFHFDCCCEINLEKRRDTSAQLLAVAIGEIE